MQQSKIRFLSRPLSDGWAVPDLSIIQSNRLPAPQLPIDVFQDWSDWITKTAEGKSAPPDYVAVSLLTAAAALIGNARTVSPWDTWTEHPVLWAALVGSPSSNKSPALDPLRTVMSDIEREMASDFDSTLRHWETDAKAAKTIRAEWEIRAEKAAKEGATVPLMPAEAVEPEKPPRPRIIVGDITREALQTIHAGQPKGLLQYRDELSSWLADMDRYGGNGGDRTAYLEAYGSRPCSVDRKGRDKPLMIDRFSVSVLGGLQPDKLSACILAGYDDGLSARFLYTWPDRVQPARPRHIADNEFALRALRRLSDLVLLEKERDGRPVLQPVNIRLDDAAAALFEQWRASALDKAERATGKFAGYLGKQPGTLLRLALVLELLWWSASTGIPEPGHVREPAILAAMGLVDEYFTPMAMRAFGDASIPEDRHLGLALARYIRDSRPTRINVRSLYRDATIPGIKDAITAKTAVECLEDYGWLRLAGGREGDSPGRQRADYEINPAVLEAA